MLQNTCGSLHVLKEMREVCVFFSQIKNLEMLLVHGYKVSVQFFKKTLINAANNTSSLILCLPFRKSSFLHLDKFY